MLILVMHANFKIFQIKREIHSQSCYTGPRLWFLLSYLKILIIDVDTGYACKLPRFLKLKERFILNLVIHVSAHLLNALKLFEQVLTVCVALKIHDSYM